MRCSINRLFFSVDFFYFSFFGTSCRHNWVCCFYFSSSWSAIEPLSSIAQGDVFDGVGSGTSRFFLLSTAIIGITLPNLVPRLVDRLRVDSIVGGSVFPCPVFWIVVPFWMTELIHLIPRTTMVLYWRWCPSVVLLRLFACHVVLFWKLPCWLLHSFVCPRSFRCLLAAWAFCYHVIVFSLVSVHELALLLLFENGISGCLWIFYI